VWFSCLWIPYSLYSYGGFRVSLKEKCEHEWKDRKYPRMRDATPQVCTKCKEQRLRYWRRKYET